MIEAITYIRGLNVVLKQVFNSKSSKKLYLNINVGTALDRWLNKSHQEHLCLPLVLKSTHVYHKPAPQQDQ